ncbi:MAG: glycosyltransferase family 4 protein [Bacteroidales bacterium]|nr:glycosyltransferase family 4 protein [Bacteroidales bacterium]
MRILMVLNEEFPPDHRVEKEADSLIGAGHQIVLLCYTTRRDLPLQEDYKGLQVKRFRMNYTLRNKLNALFLVVPFYRWIWKKHIEQIIRKDDIDAIHIHDLPLSDVGLQMKKKYGIPLICDQHEYYSNWIVQNAHLNTFTGKVVKWLSPWKRYERKYLNQADLVITIEEPLREAYIQQVGVDPEKLIKIPNTPPQSFAEIPSNPKILERYKDHFVLFYLGNIDVLRGVDVAIEALPEMIQYIPNIKLVLAGRTWKGSDPMGRAQKLGVSSYLDFAGWLSVDQIPSYIRASDICFHIPPVLREENDRTVATKIYQYLIIGKPILVAQQKMEKELVEQFEVGMAIRENDVQDFAQKVIQIYQDQSMREQFENNCRQVSHRFVWENTVVPLIDAYHRIEENRLVKNLSE